MNKCSIIYRQKYNNNKNKKRTCNYYQHAYIVATMGTRILSDQTMLILLLNTRASGKKTTTTTTFVECKLKQLDKKQRHEMKWNSIFCFWSCNKNDRIYLLIYLSVYLCTLKRKQHAMCTWFEMNHRYLYSINTYGNCISFLLKTYCHSALKKSS